MENVNRGAIFKNENATGNQPSYKGKINWGGVDIEVSMWIKESKEGKKYFSVSLQEPYKKMENTSEKMERLNSLKELTKGEDDLPF